MKRGERAAKSCLGESEVRKGFVRGNIGGDGADSCFGDCATRGEVMGCEKRGDGAWMGDSILWGAILGDNWVAAEDSCFGDVAI